MAMRFISAAIAIVLLGLAVAESRAGYNCTSTRIGNQTYTSCY